MNTAESWSAAQPGWVIHHRAAGTAMLVHVGPSGVQTVVPWGPDWGEMSSQELSRVPLQVARMDVDSVPDEWFEPGILPAGWTGWPGQPGVLGHCGDGTGWSPRFKTKTVHCCDGELAPGTQTLPAAQLVYELWDEHEQLESAITLALCPAGTIQVSAQLTNRSDGDYYLNGMNLALPVPLAADEVLDFTGRWAKERVPQRSRVGAGTHVREHRRGRPGFDASTVMLCGRPGFDFRSGQVWGLHVASGGNSRCYVKRTPSGSQLLGGGPLLHPGEVILAPEQSFTSSQLHYTQGEGLDAAAVRFHRWVRSLPAAPGLQRPVSFNVWEAVGFDHDLDRLIQLADLAASVGVERYEIDYIKWDHNRDSYEAGDQSKGGRAVAGEQVGAALRILDRLRVTHPRLEIESCSSGGARIDLEMSRHVPRFWVSDCNDPLERQAMQRWTMQLMPPEVLGTHIASVRNQTTARRHDIGFRAATAIWGHLGIEWDLTKATAEEMRQLECWVTWYKKHRHRLLTGNLVRQEIGNGTLWLHGVVSQDASWACYGLAAVGSLANELQDRLWLPGLGPRLNYLVSLLPLSIDPSAIIEPPWFAGKNGNCGTTTTTGAYLAEVGLTPP